MYITTVINQMLNSINIPFKRGEMHRTELISVCLSVNPVLSQLISQFLVLALTASFKKIKKHAYLAWYCFKHCMVK